MLLDEIVPENREELNTAIRLWFDGNAYGNMFMLRYEVAQETNYAIAMELSELLSRQRPRDAAEVWQDILKILRLLPWVVDPEENIPETKEHKVASVYHFFGGLPDCAFQQLRVMTEEGKTWGEIVEKACLVHPDSV